MTTEYSIRVPEWNMELGIMDFQSIGKNTHFPGEAYILKMICRIK